MSKKEKSLEKYLKTKKPEFESVLQSWKNLKSYKDISLREYLINNCLMNRTTLEEILLNLPWDDNNSQVPNIPGYTIIDQISQGGMGEIYKVIHQNTQRPCVIKTLLPKYTKDQEFCKRFLREGKIALQLSNPYIVKCLDVFQLENTMAICFEWVEGRNNGYYPKSSGRSRIIPR